MYQSCDCYMLWLKPASDQLINPMIKRGVNYFMLPANSVAIIFAYPSRTFSQDVSYPYHPNPDLYYFSGYKEPNAVLIIFKENQPGTGSNKTYNELFFIQKRDPLQESWTGKRMGVE